MTVMLVLVALSSIFLEYWEYSKAWYANPDVWAQSLRGQTDAPQQYRVAVLKAADFFALHTHTGMRHGITLIDLAALLGAMFVLRSLLLRSAAWRAASASSRWFGAAAFVLLLQFFLAWLTWYQRPETLACAGLLAGGLLLASRRIGSGGAGVALAVVATIALGLLQGVTRADVGFAFHAGIAMVCLTPLGKGFALPRWLQCATSALAAAAAAGTQLYIMRVVYPQATYGTTPVFELLLNITDHLRIVPFVLFLVPVAWGLWQVAQKRVAVTSAQAGLMLGSAVFFLLWCTVGKIDEVRIFLPFAFALTPLLVESAMVRFTPTEAVR